jgi:hypothetical protein
VDRIHDSQSHRSLALLSKPTQLSQLDSMREMVFEPLFKLIGNPNIAFIQVIGRRVLLYLTTTGTALRYELEGRRFSACDLPVRACERCLTLMCKVL